MHTHTTIGGRTGAIGAVTGSAGFSIDLAVGALNGAKFSVVNALLPSGPGGGEHHPPEGSRLHAPPLGGSTSSSIPRPRSPQAFTVPRRTQ